MIKNCLLARVDPAKFLIQGVLVRTNPDFLNPRFPNIDPVFLTQGFLNHEFHRIRSVTDTPLTPHFIKGKPKAPYAQGRSLCGGRETS